MMFVAGSGEVLIPSRSTRLDGVAGERRHSRPAGAERLLDPRDAALPPNWNPSTTAIAGRMTVWTESQMLSSQGSCR